MRALDRKTFRSGLRQIFTDVPVEPGRVYFMQPLSNPMRVDPIVVPTGDLVWPEAGRVR